MLVKIIKINLLVAVIAAAGCLSSCDTMKTQNDKFDEQQKIATAKINTQLGIAYLQQGDVQRAKQKLLLAMKEAPKIPETWYSMAYYLEATGNKTEAQNYYLKSITIAPKDGASHNNYGTFLCREGQYQASIQQFMLAAQDPNYLDNAAAYENAGLCATKIPDRKLAMAYFERALEQDPGRAISAEELKKLQKQTA